MSSPSSALYQITGTINL
ncbi:hypothetical protein ACXPJE_001813 [Escherichia albertii]